MEFNKLDGELKIETRDNLRDFKNNGEEYFKTIKLKKTNLVQNFYFFLI